MDQPPLDHEARVRASELITRLHKRLDDLVRLADPLAKREAWEEIRLMYAELEEVIPAVLGPP